MQSPADPTRLLDAVAKGNASLAEDLLPAVYAELRRLAAAKMAKEASGHTLQATALVHEAWLRMHPSGAADANNLSVPKGRHWQNRAHFFSAAAEAMRRILIESARRKKALRHGGGLERLDIEEVEIAAPASTKDDELLAVHEALEKLSARDPAKAELVKLRYFAGLTIEEAADVLGISSATAKRYWTFARAWLYQAIQNG